MRASMFCIGSFGHRRVRIVRTDTKVNREIHEQQQFHC